MNIFHRASPQSSGAPCSTSGLGVDPIVGALFFSGALAVAFFYHGPQIELLAIAQILLLVWFGWVVIRAYHAGLVVPWTPLAVAITCFWVWLGASTFVSRASGVSVFSFWWVGSFALVYWIYTLTPERERAWRYGAYFALTSGVALAIYALVQLFVLHHAPRATFVNIHSFAALLVLLALPAAAYFLTGAGRPRRIVDWLLPPILFLFFFTVAATQGRGTALSLLLGFALLAGLSWRLVSLRRLALLAALLILAYLCANLVLHGALGARIATLVDPADAGVPRFVIWRASWALLADAPWYGVGLGTYYLAFAPYRDLADSSLGFFAHNDYLQLWIEIGWPGLLLLLAVYAGVAWMLVRAWRADLKNRISEPTPPLPSGEGGLTLIPAEKEILTYFPSPSGRGQRVRAISAGAGEGTGEGPSPSFPLPPAGEGGEPLCAARTSHSIELAGLASGLAAIAVHSFVDFNFYILPISIAAGLMLGRFQELAVAADVTRVNSARARTIAFKPARFVQSRAYVIIVLLLTLFPIGYLAALGISNHWYQRGLAEAAEGDLARADEYFARAERLTPADDKVLLAHADLLRIALERLPENARTERRALYDDAHRLLTEAENANPYRALVFAVRGQLYQSNPDFSGMTARAQAAAEYTRALALNPRFFHTRMAYARMLLDGGDEPGALRLLEQGVGHWYYPEPSLIAYYDLTAALSRRAGDLAAAERFARRGADVKTKLAALGSPRFTPHDTFLATKSAR